MSTGLIQTPLEQGAAALSGKISATIYEKDGTTPTTIIKSDQDWYVLLKWEMSGPFVPTMAGSWHAHLNLESMGPGVETSLFSGLCSQDWKTDDPAKYECKLTVNAGQLGTIPHQGAIFRAIVTLVYRDATGHPGPIAGYVDCGLVQIFNP